MRMVAIIAMLGVTACASAPEENNSGEMSVSDVVGDWSADLRPASNSNVRGELKVQSALAGMALTLSVSGAPAGSHLPWHVHRGTCATGGPIHGDAGAYPMLHAGSDGTARVTGTLPAALNEQERYHVNIHRSATELGTIIACGDLSN